MRRLWLMLAVPATAMAGDWSLEVGEDPTSYETVASVSQEAGNTIKDEYATKDVTPLLSFRCTPGNAAISAQIDWQRFISSFNTEVGFKVDGGSFLWQKWGVDSSNKLTRSRSADDAASLLERLETGARLEVEITPYSEGPVTVSFDLAGLGEGLEALRNECG